MSVISPPFLLRLVLDIAFLMTVGVFAFRCFESVLYYLGVERCMVGGGWILFW